MRWTVNSTSNGMKKILLIAVILAVMLVGWMLWKNKGDIIVNTPTPTVSPMPTPLVSPELTMGLSPVVTNNIITYTDAGYTPNLITIKKGETVVWKNESNSFMWTASAIHPTHKVYPGTDITACGTQTLLPMLDSCGRIESGQSWSFKFDNIGTWGYHNHLNSSKFGKVVVE